MTKYFFYLLSIICFGFASNADEIVLKNCTRDGGTGAKYEFRVLKQNNLVLEYWHTSKVTIKWPIKIYENNFIESEEKKLKLGDNRVVLRMFLDKKQVQIDYLPNGSTFNYKCR